jgi:hypothetical protein
LTVLAQQIGYADVQGAEYRVMALRPTNKEMWSPAMAQETPVMIALCLGLIDPPFAKRLLQSVESAADSIGSGASGVGRRDWLTAWTLVDPQRAVELAVQELAGAKETEARKNAVYSAMDVVQLLLTPAGDRQKQITQNHPDMRSPEGEY